MEMALGAAFNIGYSTSRMDNKFRQIWFPGKINPLNRGSPGIFPLADYGGGNTVADHIGGTTPHVQQGIDAQQQGKTGLRNIEGGQGTGYKPPAMPGVRLRYPCW